MELNLMPHVLDQHGPITHLHLCDEETGILPNLEFLWFTSVKEFDKFIATHKIFCDCILETDEQTGCGIEVFGQPVRLTKIPGPLATYFVEPEGGSYAYMIIELATFTMGDKEMEYER